jgi:N,N-dimethylformamidase
MDADDSTHMLDGLRGGFWSDNGRAPRDLVGLTFIAQGSESPAPGHRIRGDVPAESAWALGGLRPGLAVGTSGRLMGGSAGHEIDWVDPDLPSAGPVTVLASSGGHAPTLQISSERLARTRDAAGLRPRSDVVLYEPPAGGLVFSVGSICWAGGLAFPGGDPGVRALTETVLRRFLDPASARTRAQAAVSPPSTTSVLPVTNAAPGPTR